MHELLIKVAGMYLKVITGQSVCTEVYRKYIGHLNLTNAPIVFLQSLTRSKLCFDPILYPINTLVHSELM